MERLKNIKVSEGTHPVSILISFRAFRWTDKSLVQEINDALGLTSLCNGFKLDYYNQITPQVSEEVLWELIEHIEDFYNTIAPSGYYFGTHPSNNSLGFWEVIK